MKTRRLLQWIRALAYSVALFQIASFGWMLHEHPVMVMFVGITLFFELGIAVLFVLLAASLRASPSAEDRCRHALGWMLLACLPIWPISIASPLHLDLGQAGTASMILVGVALLVRELSWRWTRWLAPLGTALGVVLLLPHAQDLAPGGVLVAGVLLLHTCAVLFCPTEEPSDDP